jgi:hypothetical protein
MSKFRMIWAFSIGENYYYAMRRRGLCFEDLMMMSGASRATVYRVIGARAPNVSENLLSLGVALGFSEKEIRAKARQERSSKDKNDVRRGKFFRLLDEVFEYVWG